VKEDRLKLGDFGLSKLIDMTASINQQLEIDMGGTPPYMSPEIIESNGSSASSIEIITKSDVWSLGCVVYEMCALERLFHGPSRANYMYEIRNFIFNEQKLNLNRPLIVPLLKR
jgi:NIMA (never in mitosis gene a)-related kinase